MPSSRPSLAAVCTPVHRGQNQGIRPHNGGQLRGRGFQLGILHAHQNQVLHAQLGRVLRNGGGLHGVLAVQVAVDGQALPAQMLAPAAPGHQADGIAVLADELARQQAAHAAHAQHGNFANGAAGPGGRTGIHGVSPFACCFISLCRYRLYFTMLAAISRLRRQCLPILRGRQSLPLEGKVPSRAERMRWGVNQWQKSKKDKWCRRAITNL